MRNPEFDRRVKHLQERMSYLNTLHRKKRRPAPKNKENRAQQVERSTPKQARRENNKISVAEMMDGYRHGMSLAMLKKMRERRSDTRSERQMAPKELERQRMRGRERQHVRERELSR